MTGDHLVIAGALQIFGGRDKVQEAEVQQWIETVTGEQWPAGAVYSEYLRSVHCQSASASCLRSLHTFIVCQ